MAAQAGRVRDEESALLATAAPYVTVTVADGTVAVYTVETKENESVSVDAVTVVVRAVSVLRGIKVSH